MKRNTEKSPSPSSDHGEGAEDPGDSAQCCTRGMRKGKTIPSQGQSTQGEPLCTLIVEEQARSTCSR